MRIITESPEHHFLSFLEKLRNQPGNWAGCVFALSQKLVHEDLLARKADIAEILQARHAESVAFFNDVKMEAAGLNGAMLYHFADNDVILLTRMGTVQERDALKTAYGNLAGLIDPGLSSFGLLSKEYRSYQKIADHKFIMEKRMQAYHALANVNKTETISLRRQRRDDPMVMVVEDDRFTAAYAASILRDFDVVMARSGEDAIVQYVEQAPDIVFLDIHLPGLTGHQTLQALRAADQDAFVVMLSVDAIRSNIINATHNGAACFLKKPFTKDRLLNVVRQSPFIRKGGHIVHSDASAPAETFTSV